ncbi:MAG: hypothetical protein K9J37_11315 [Saprospiraceae bacterium]|nr:hypothetical protein [Saprospiraceae bacterium]MCF8250494.1 hypothetical protein [Saprospiraceae bacterium]MCF8279634.1 hypothetical protein [Bacteroidales bacterium]MCF8312420.1 hypothetical protein [Saprospiraceae bacterium]MCF8440763.1 hypothetical protein [Saprospiraceae bacterium]
MLKLLPNWLLIFLLFFNAIGAYYGSYMLISDPSGSKIKMPIEMLQGTPFSDYLIPGFILLLVNGILPTIAGLGLILQRPRKPLIRFSFLQNYLWAWALSLFSGIGLTVWIGVQISMISGGEVDTLQLVYGALGVLITGVTLLPIVRNRFKIASEP